MAIQMMLKKICQLQQERENMEYSKLIKMVLYILFKVSLEDGEL